MTAQSLPRRAIVGIDTHKDVHVAVALDQDGRVIADRSARSTERGCSDLRKWAVHLAPTVEFAIEGTGSYGAGLSRYLAKHGCRVTEVRGPSRKVRHDRGKSDRVDAEAAARSLLAGASTVVPKSGDDWVEMVRILRIARISAVHNRSQACNQLQAVVVSAPLDMRDELQSMSKSQLIAKAAKFRVTGSTIRAMRPGGPCVYLHNVIRS